MAFDDLEPDSSESIESSLTDSVEETDTTTEEIAEDSIVDVAESPVGKPEITFQGNNYDLASVIGVTLGGAVLFSCATCGLGYYLLPFIPLIMGGLGLAMAKDSVNPDRTKLLSWISLGIGGLFVLVLVVIILAYIIFFMALFGASASGGFESF